MTDYAKELGGETNQEITEKKMTVANTETFDADIRASIDIQVATARAYPRSLKKVLENITFLSTQDKETAESCFYSVKRDGKTIRGASIRLAEIITSCYGNIRASSRIISNDGKFITAQGMCWDLENNVAFSVEVKRKITDRFGRIFTDDMIVITSNACTSIALRNAVFKVIPQAVTSRVQNEIKRIILGEAKDFETTRKSAIEYFTQKGVSEKNILALFDKKSIDELDREDIFDLRGIANAIIDGDTTLELAFAVNTKPTAIGKASRFLSVPTDEGDAEYEKTNINKEIDNKVYKDFETVIDNNSDKTITAEIKTNITLDEVEFGNPESQPKTNTNILPENNDSSKSKIKPNDDFLKDGKENSGYTGGNVIVVGENIEEKKDVDENVPKPYKLEINSVTDEKGNELSPSLYAGINKENLVKTDNPPAITTVNDNQSNSFEIENDKLLDEKLDDKSENNNKKPVEIKEMPRLTDIKDDNKQTTGRTITFKKKVVRKTKKDKGNNDLFGNEGQQQS